MKPRDFGYHVALVTGASSGLGAAFARQLAARGCDLMLVARSRQRLQQLADELVAQYGCRVKVVVADLSKPAPGQALAQAASAAGLEIDLLVNDAGFATVGAFADADAAREQDEISLNVAAVVDLCHAFLPGMIQRGHGAIINVASLAAMQPLPYMSVYAATKAFVLSFSSALWAEVHSKGVHVMAVCPGPVDTHFFDATGRSGLRETVPHKLMLSAPAVVAGSLRALARHRIVYTPGVANRAAAAGVPFMPRKLLARTTAAVMRRGDTVHD
ncbi:MAG: SDR family oxidoreductase [Sinobacteraceae bacterium]|nr:SDR family oxidoreductase [Nevskiaceae bacterium]